MLKVGVWVSMVLRVCVCEYGAESEGMGEYGAESVGVGE